MKVAVIGRGKTGSKVIELLEGNCPYQVFSSQNPLTEAALKDCDVAIAFVSGEVLLQLAPTLLAAKTPLVVGATGWTPAQDLLDALSRENITWVWGTNFSLGMRLVHEMIKALSKTSNYFDQDKNEFSFKLHEVHHTQKLDGPSGTAKSWASWLNLPTAITFERTGDVVGDHELVLETAHEKITLRHEALDRKIFAQGAIWMAHKLIEDKKAKKPKIPPGLQLFEELVLKL